MRYLICNALGVLFVGVGVDSLEADLRGVFDVKLTGRRVGCTVLADFSPEYRNRKGFI